MLTSSITNTPWLVEYIEDNGDQPEEYRHIFCGEQDMEGGVCPNCGNRLLRFFQIDMGDPKLADIKLPLAKVDLLFCWKCDASQQPLFYRLLGDNSLKIISHGTGEIYSTFPYRKYPDFFPRGRARLTPMDKELQKLLIGYMDEDEEVWEAANKGLSENYPEYDIPRHQLGGVPYLAQPEGNLHCPECGKEMPFFMAVGDDCLDPRGFTDNVGVQALYFICPDCGVVGCHQQCD